MLIGVVLSSPAFSQADAPTPTTGHQHTHRVDAPLHFSHPLIAESPSPDTKLRIDYQFRDIDNHEADSKEQTLRLEAEYAFHQSMSIEIDVPYVFTDPSGQSNQNRLGDIEIGLKLATFAWAAHGVLVGGGLELGLPTGNDDKAIGTDHVLTIEPFVDVGYKADRVEIVGFLAFGIPTNEPSGEKDEVDLELEFNIAFSFHLTPQVIGLFEIDGSSVVSGHENETVVNLTPGIKIRPDPDQPCEIGVGVSFPVSNDDEFDTQVRVSVFRHF